VIDNYYIIIAAIISISAVWHYYLYDDIHDTMDKGKNDWVHRLNLFGMILLIISVLPSAITVIVLYFPFMLLGRVSRFIFFESDKN